VTGLPDPAVRPFMTVGELLDVLPLGRSALYQAAKDGSIPGARYVGRRLVFATAQLRWWAGLGTNGSNGSDATMTGSSEPATVGRDAHHNDAEPT